MEEPYCYRCKKRHSRSVLCSQPVVSGRRETPVPKVLPRNYVTDDDPSPFMGEINKMSNHLWRMEQAGRAGIGRLVSTIPAGKVEVMRVQGVEYVKIDAVATGDYYIVEIRNISGSVKRYWKIGKDGVNAEMSEAAWKYRLFSGQDNPVTFEVSVKTANRVPSRSMEWVAGESAILGLPVTPKYRSDKVSSTDERARTDISDIIYTGIPHVTAIGNAITTPPKQSSGTNVYTGTWTRSDYLRYKVGGVDTDDPSFSSCDLSSSSTAVWSMAGENVYTGTEEITGIDLNAADSYIAIGDKKTFGCSVRSTANSREFVTVAWTNIALYNKSRIGEYSTVQTCSPLMYGQHVLNPQIVRETTENISSSMALAPIPSSDVFYGPASGTYETDITGSYHAPEMALGTGDNEFVAQYRVTDQTQNYTRNCTQALYTKAQTSYHPPTYEWHGNFGAEEWSAHEASYSTTSKLAFRVKGAITQIDLGTSTNTDPYTMTCDGRECDTHFVVLYTRRRLTAPVFYSYELIVINKVTGGYERIPIGDESTWGQSLRIALKGVGPDVYAE